MAFCQGLKGKRISYCQGASSSVCSLGHGCRNHCNNRVGPISSLCCQLHHSKRPSLLPHSHHHLGCESCLSLKQPWRDKFQCFNDVTCIFPCTNHLKTFLFIFGKLYGFLRFFWENKKDKVFFFWAWSCNLYAKFF